MSGLNDGRKEWITEVVEKKIALGKLITGIVLLVISVPVFIFYNIFPTINPQIGPHQIASWIEVTFSFAGFVIIIMASGELDW